MKTLEDQIQAALREALSDECVPLTADEVIHRASTAVPNERGNARRIVTFLAICAAAAGVLAIATTAVVRDDGPDLASAPDHELPYLVPSSLPVGWTVVDAFQSDHGSQAAADPALRARYRRDTPAARIELSARRVDPTRFQPSQERTVTTDDGVIGWTTVHTMERQGLEVEWMRQDGFLVEVSALGWDRGTEESVTRLVDLITIDAAGRPVLDPARGFSLEAISPDPAAQVLANYTTVYGPQGDDDLQLVITVERFDRPLDVRFRVGVFAEPTQFAGREIWIGDGSTSATWQAAPDMVVTVYGSIDDAVTHALRLREVTASEFADATGLVTPIG